MAQIVLQRINDGDTGSMSAQKIYSNDSKLLSAIRGIEDLLDAYGTLITIRTEDREISIVEAPGSGTTSVMTQKAVTDFVNESVENMCVIGGEILGGVEMPSPKSYDDVMELIGEMQNHLADLERRVTILEQENAG